MLKFITFVLLVAAVAASLFLWQWREKSLNSAMRYEVETLSTTKAALEAGQIPTRWDAATFVSDKMLDQWIKSFVGTRALITKPAKMQVEVVDAGFKISRNLPEVVLEISARPTASIASHAGMRLRATGILVYSEGASGQQKPLPALPEGKLSLRITRLKPVLTWNDLSWAPSPLIESIFAQGLNSFLEGQLAFNLSLAQTVTVPVVGDVDEVIETDDGKGSITLRRTSGLKEVAVPLSGSLPVVVTNGVWIVSAVPGKQLPHPDPLQADLETQRDLLRDEVNQLLRNSQEPKSDVIAWIGQGWIESLIEKFNAAEDSARRMEWKSIAAKGKILDDDWGGPEHLEGGAYVELASSDAASALLQLGKISTDWSENGVGVGLAGSANASARIHAHIDPFIGGGFGVNTTIDARPGPLNLQGQLRAKSLQLDSDSALAVGFVPKCQDFELNLLAGGSIEFGARIFPLIGDRIPAPAVLGVSGTSIESLSAPVATEAMKPDLATWPKLHVTWKPAGMAGSRDGYLVEAGVQVARATDLDLAGAEAEEARRKHVEARAREQWATDFAPSCPAKRDAVFLLAGQDFGPNNEIVKALKFLGEQLQRQGHNLEVAYKDFETVVKNPADVGKVAGNIAQRAGQEVQRVLDDGRKVIEGTARESEKLIRGGLRAIGFR